MARVWVTRAQPGAEATAERLRALGHEPVVAPLIEVRPIPGAVVELGGVGSIAFSSANGVAAFAALSAVRDRRVYAVGRATGRAAQRAGFADVAFGDADVAALARLIVEDDRRPGGAVLHVSPAEPAGDLVGALTAAGVEARRAVLYETVATGAATPRGIDAILIHSPKAARILVDRAGGDPALKAAMVRALSEACAAPMRASRFARVEVARSPTEDALLVEMQL